MTRDCNEQSIFSEIYIGNDKNDRQINLLFQENVYTIWSCWKDEETFEANVVKAN